MRRLVLVRHAAVELRDDRPALEWALSEAGRRDAVLLAREPVFAGVEVVASSPEGKALRTAEPIAAVVGVPLIVDEGLREVARGRQRVVGRDAYVGLVRSYFAGEGVAGWEPEAKAAERFSTAVERVLGGTAGDVCLVTHGLVASLYLARLRGLPAPNLAEWEAMPLPAVFVADPVLGRVLSGWSAVAGAPSPRG